MKIIVEEVHGEEEEEVILRVREIDESLMKLINNMKASRERLAGYVDDSIKMLDPKGIYYFEAVDNKVYAYCEKEVYEIRKKLYEVETQFINTDFIRASKSTIINISKIQKLTPEIGGRFHVLLKNGERTVISRQYVPVLKKKLGIH